MDGAADPDSRPESGQGGHEISKNSMLMFDHQYVLSSNSQDRNELGAAAVDNSNPNRFKC